MNECFCAVWTTSHTLIPFVLIKLVHKNTMLYQLCFDIFWFIQLKTVQNKKLQPTSTVGWVILEWFYALRPFDLWKHGASTNECTNTQNSCLTSRLDWIVISANSSAGMIFSDRGSRREWGGKPAIAWSEVGREVNTETFLFVLLWQSEKKSAYWKYIYWKTSANRGRKRLHNDDVIFPPFRINQIVSIFCNRFPQSVEEAAKKKEFRRLMW